MTHTSSAPLKVVFVCTANICRSAYAEARARQLCESSGFTNLEFSSAGTRGFNAAQIDDEMQQQLIARGGDASAHRSQRLTRDIVADADLILTAEAEHRNFVLEEWPAAMRRTYTLGQFAKILERLDGDEHGRDAIAAAFPRRVHATKELDIKDPYRRGTEAAQACAQHVDQLLAAVLPRLAVADAQ